MSTPDGGPVFPQPDRPADPDAPDDERGLSLRDYFAGQALIAFMCNPKAPDLGPDDADKLAADCYKLADAMLKARQA